MVIEVPAELKCRGEAMADSLPAVRKAMACADSGKSVDYAKAVDPVSLRAGVVSEGWLPRTASGPARHLP